MEDYSNKKVAVVLSGGSAKGLAHIGVLRGLEEMGIQPSLIVGTSMGSIIGALYSWNPNWGWVASEVKKHKIKDILSFKEFMSIKKGLVKGSKFELIFKKAINNADFKDLKIPLVINATDITTGKTVAFTKGKVVDAVRASISIPLVFNPQKKGKMVLVDGGLTENLYFSYVVPKASQYDLFLLVDFSMRPRHFRQDYSVLGITMQSLSIMMRNQINANLKLLELDHSPKAKLFKKKMVRISPSVQDMSLTQFNKADLAIKRGYTSFKNSKHEILTILNAKK